MFERDRNWLAGGVVASIVLIVGRALEMPMLAAGTIAAMAFVVATTAFVLEPLSSWIGTKRNHVAPVQPRSGLASDLTSAAMPMRRRLMAHGNASGDALVATTIVSMIVHLDVVLQEIKRRPGDAATVGRLFNFYLPRTLDILDARKAMLGDPKFDAKIAQADATIVDISKAFEHYATTMDRRGSDLDLEMRLVRSSLVEDVGMDRSAKA